MRTGDGGWRLGDSWQVGGARRLSVVACGAARAVCAAGPRLHLVHIQRGKLQPLT